MTEAGPSSLALEVLQSLKRHRLVLLSGPPGTGKTHLMDQVKTAFKATVRSGYDPEGDVPFPYGVDTPDIGVWLPSPQRNEREVFSTVFHPHSHHREFVGGISPRLDGQPGFVPVRGTLVQANDFAERGAALLIIDELNRGPAVQLFGDTIVAIEGDKRRHHDGRVLPTTASFRLLHGQGEQIEETLSAHLYILAAMNRADTSIEPLDVAFLRRWHERRLEPDPAVLAAHFDVDLAAMSSLPSTADDDDGAAALYLALIAAWQAVNGRLALGRGPEYRIGHGVLMAGQPPAGGPAQFEYVAERWRCVRLLLEEIFFGDDAGQGVVLNAGPDKPYRVERLPFGDATVERLVADEPADSRQLYRLLRAVAG